MTHSLATYSNDPPPDTIELDASPSTPASPPSANPIAIFHGFLRGRYHWAILLGLLAAMGGAYLGHQQGRPIYRSVGLVRITPNKPIIGGTPSVDSSPIPFFDAYVESQASFMRSQQVYTLAAENPEWQTLGRGFSPAILAAFEDSLEILHPRNTELIQVTCTDISPQAARLTVKCVIEAYQKIYGQRDEQIEEKKIQILEDLEHQLTDQHHKINDQIFAIANEFGSDSLDQLYQFKMQEVNKLEAEYRLAELSIAQSKLTPTTQNAATQAAPTDLTPMQIALLDPEMRAYLHRREELQESLKTTASHFAENHPTLIQIRSSIQSVDSSIKNYAENYNDARRKGVIANNSISPAFNPGLPIEQLEARLAGVKLLYEKARQEAIDLGRKNLQINALRDDAETINQRLHDTKKRLDQVRLESGIFGRVSIISDGERPLKPYKDPRKQFAAIGGVVGLLLGFGVVLLRGAFDRRFRNIDDACGTLAPSAPVLGILPELTGQIITPERTAIAAHSIHHIRTLLQLRPSTSKSDQHIFALTSPSPGDGKTSLAIALGLSFTNSGSKTLLLDCDIVGAGLSSRIAPLIRPQLGQILLRSSIITPQQLDEALVASRLQHRPLGETLVESGLITRSILARALADQLAPSPGLFDVINGRPLKDCISEIDHLNLFVLPVGAAQANHAGRFSPSAIRVILNQARQSFDTILIDTGPILGSIEASAVSKSVDGVVMTVSRTEQRPLAQRALQHLSSINAPIAGLVFNRAQTYDINHSNFSISTSTRASIPSSAIIPVAPPPSPQLQTLGPLALAVLAATNTSH